MKRPIINQNDRFLIKYCPDCYRSIALQVRIAILHLKRELDKTPLLQFVHWINTKLYDLFNDPTQNHHNR
jgi:hypothetical protein